MTNEVAEIVNALPFVQSHRSQRAMRDFLTLGQLSMLKHFPAEYRARAIIELNKLGMKDQALQRAGTLSGGQQQRVAISRAMMQQPEILLADEPVASLDPRNTHAVMSTLSQINAERGITVLVNLHSIEIARQYCHRVIGLRDGRLVFDASIDELTDQALKTVYDGDEFAEVTAHNAKPETETTTIGSAA